MVPAGLPRHPVSMSHQPPCATTGCPRRAGYLIQPHTSAGRIPTDSYRFFVDALRDSQTELATADLSTLRDFFAGTHGQLESMMQRTSDMLTSLTD